MASGHELRVLTDEALFAACGTRIAFTTRAGGVSAPPYAGLNLSHNVSDDLAAVDENRRLLSEAMGALGHHGSLISPLQVHGCDIVAVEDVTATQERAALGADGILCTLSNIPVLLCFADCVPVILVAPDGSFAVLHAGWRGAWGGIPGLGLDLLVNATNCLVTDVNCYIGPHIGSCCYEFDEELLADFVGKYGSSCDAGNRYLDLTQAVKSSLIGSGANSDRIAWVDACTACNTNMYYSHRAERGLTGRHGAYAMRREAI